MGAYIMIAQIIGQNTCCKIHYYVKLDEKKNGLAVYKLGIEHFNAVKYTNEEPVSFICPLCDNIEMGAEVMRQLKEILKKGFKQLNKHFDYYKNWIDDKNEIDIFENLEINYNKIQDIKENYDEYKYFRYRCPKKNEEIYIIFEDVPKSKRDAVQFNLKDQRYEYTRWKNDPNLKKTLLELRQKEYDAYQLEQKREKINKELDDKKEELLKQWNDKNWKNEYSFYQQMCQEAKNRFNSRKHDSFYSTFDYPLCTQIYGELNVQKFKYMGAKLKFAEYCSSLAKDESNRALALSTIKKYIFMSDEEEKMFNNFSNPILEALRLKLENEEFKK